MLPVKYELYLLQVLTLGHPFSSDLDTGLGQSLDEDFSVQTVHVSRLLGFCRRELVINWLYSRIAVYWRNIGPIIIYQ